jgi:hypothetical protein
MILRFSQSNSRVTRWVGTIIQNIGNIVVSDRK